MASTNALESLKQHGTVISSDTGEYNLISPFHPTDATTNPSLVYAAVSKSGYDHLVDLAIEYACQRRSSQDEQVELAMERLLVEVGRQTLERIPGQVSVSLDPRLGYNEDRMLKSAMSIASIFEELGISKDRFLIKIPATWEGISVARSLEETHKLRTNLTLIFGLVQAYACAEAGVTVVSPFVGRIKDWHLKQSGRTSYEIHEHPGILTVRQIQKLYSDRGYPTRIMAAGFRNTEEIFALAGLHLMTLPPSLLSDLESTLEVIPSPPPISSVQSSFEPVGSILDEEVFRSKLQAERIAVEKVSEGLEKFSADTDLLEALIRDRVKKYLLREDGFESRL